MGSFSLTLIKLEHKIDDENLNFMRIVEKISVSPDEMFNVPLVADSTHLNWSMKFKNSTPSVQVPSQFAINGILLNYYCEGTVTNYGDSVCCGSGRLP